jgi:hypothetical protein
MAQNVKDGKRSLRGRVQRYYASLYPRLNTYRIAGLQAEVKTKDLTNVHQQRKQRSNF